MRHQGTIVSWDLGRGIGAIQWHGGEERVFVRVTDFPEGIRRPEVGDVVTYFRGIDHRGRPIASIVEYATTAGLHPPFAAIDAGAVRARSVPDPVARARVEHAPAEHVRHAHATAQTEIPSFARATPGHAWPWPRVAVALVVLVLIAVVAWSWL